VVSVQSHEGKIEGRSVGERNFRDFFRLLSAKENRTQPMDLGSGRPTWPNNSPAAQREKETMPTDTQKNAEFITVCKEVINILEDGQKGFADIGSHLKNETLKRYFLAESLKRANFRAELENELHRHGVHDVHEEGTAAGAARRIWFDLKEKLHKADDHSLLETAEEGEDEAKRVYADALAQEIPLPLRQLLAEQNSHVLSSHAYIRDHRDVAASK
jgi:uncharacterized protein (TIGR02284 family)